MLELPALEFLSSVAEIRRVATLLDQFQQDKDEAAVPEVRTRMALTMSGMCDHLMTIGAQSAWVAANRFYGVLEDHSEAVTFATIRRHLADIESRFVDHLTFIRLFVVRSEQMPLLGTPVELLGEPTAGRFPSLWFDCEEAAKCILVLRPTAAVFHAMRMLEIAVRSLAKRLNIPDPISPSARNWGRMLGTIKKEIDSQFPPGQRLPHSQGCFLEEVYASLDAVKNPWRNATMHVEGIYTDAEANYILFCTIRLIQKIASGFDEDGNEVQSPPLPIP